MQQDFGTLYRKNHPVYLLADLSIRHRFLGHHNNNERGNYFCPNISNGNFQHLGPDFNTLINRRGKPDTILANRHALLHHHISEGNQTTSDHIPIIMKISTSPIVIPIPTTYDLNKANWDLYKQKINESIQSNPNPKLWDTNNLTANEIDEKLSFWINSINNATTVTVPEKRHKILPHPKRSDLLNLLIAGHNNIKHLLILYGPTPIYSAYIRNLQDNIKNENLNIHTKFWNNKIKKLARKYRDNDGGFWRDIRKLRGGGAPWEIFPHI